MVISWETTLGKGRLENLQLYFFKTHGSTLSEKEVNYSVNVIFMPGSNTLGKETFCWNNSVRVGFLSMKQIRGGSWLICFHLGIYEAWG